jgi:hypothetical protein
MDNNTHLKERDSSLFNCSSQSHSDICNLVNKTIGMGFHDYQAI